MVRAIFAVAIGSVIGALASRLTVRAGPHSSGRTRATPAGPSPRSCSHPRTVSAPRWAASCPSWTWPTTATAHASHGNAPAEARPAALANARAIRLAYSSALAPSEWPVACASCSPAFPLILCFSDAAISPSALLQGRRCGITTPPSPTSPGSSTSGSASQTTLTCVPHPWLAHSASLPLPLYPGSPCVCEGLCVVEAATRAV